MVIYPRDVRPAARGPAVEHALNFSVLRDEENFAVGFLTGKENECLRPIG